MQYRLSRVSVERDAVEHSWRLQLPVTVGRTPESPVCIDDDSISRSHCQLFLASDETLMVRDLGSMNGTYVNGSRIQQAHSLVPGDVLQLGSISLRVDYTSEDDPLPSRASNSRGSMAATQRMKTIPHETFTMKEVNESPKRWWEFWKPD
jgi:pSer/pThr/pTyr-binding forkhead associated (FHA) protein